MLGFFWLNLAVNKLNNCFHILPAADAWNLSATSAKNLFIIQRHTCKLSFLHHLFKNRLHVSSSSPELMETCRETIGRLHLKCPYVTQWSKTSNPPPPPVLIHGGPSFHSCRGNKYINTQALLTAVSWATCVSTSTEMKLWDEPWKGPIDLQHSGLAALHWPPCTSLTDQHNTQEAQPLQPKPTLNWSLSLNLNEVDIFIFVFYSYICILLGFL